MLEWSFLSWHKLLAGISGPCVSFNIEDGSVPWRTACGNNHTKLHLHEVPNGLVDLEMGAGVRCTCCTVKPSNQYATHRSGLVTGLSRLPEGRGMAEED